MAKRLSLEEKLAKVAALEDEPVLENAERELRKTLKGANSILAAKAARVAAKRGIAGLMPDMTAAFLRFMEKPAKADQGCRAKYALVEALDELGYDDADPFLQGLRHVQMEPVFGGEVDTAAALRGKCALSLVRVGCADILFELVGLLMDSEVEPRRAAVQAFAFLECDASELVLRMKALAGDSDSEVVGECLGGLMKMAPKRSLSFVVPYIESLDPVVAESAALALGESGGEEAFDILRTHWETSFNAERKKMLLVAMARSRTDEAFELILGEVREGPRDRAMAAVTALVACGMDDRRRASACEAVLERDDAAVSDAYESVLGPLA